MIGVEYPFPRVGLHGRIEGRSVQIPHLFPLPRRGEDEGGSLNGLNDLNFLNILNTGRASSNPFIIKAVEVNLPRHHRFLGRAQRRLFLRVAGQIFFQ